MKLRHAAALALVGWYLMAPPIAKNFQSVLQAPLSRWSIEAGFDSADACNQAKFAVTQGRAVSKLPNLPANARATISTAHRMSQCIASDDPRLKGK
jgi:hypothetical protein